MQRKLMGNDHPHVAVSLANLGALLRDKHDYDASEAVFHDAVAMNRKIRGEEHWHTANSRSHLGECLTKMGRYEEAEKELLEAQRILNTTLGKDHKRTIKAVERLVALYDAWGKPDKAAEYRAMLENGEW